MCCASAERAARITHGNGFVTEQAKTTTTRNQTTHLRLLLHHRRSLQFARGQHQIVRGHFVGRVGG